MAVTIKPPILQGDRERERHATWLELLYDLIFVAAVAQLAATLSADYTPAGLLRFVLISVPVWWAWVGHTFYLTRFDTDDLVHRLLTMVQMIAVAALASNVPEALGATSNGFAVSYAAVRGILVLEYLRAGHHVPQARPLTRRYSLGFGAALLLWLFSTQLAPPYRFLAWGLGILVDFLTPVTARSIHFRFPPHQMHLPERFGLFTIIVIGEAVAGAVAGREHHGLDPSSGLVGVLGLLMAFSFWWGYFEGAHGASLRLVKSSEQVGRYQLWLYAHLPLVMGITATAAGVRHVLALPLEARLPFPGALILSGAVGVSCLALSGIFLAAYPATRSHELQRFLIPYYLIASAGSATGLLGAWLPGSALLGLLTLCCLAQLFFTFRRRPS